MDPFVKAKVNKSIGLLKKHVSETVLDIPEMKYRECGYKQAQQIPESFEVWDTFRTHDRVHGKDSHFWFAFEIDTPAAAEGTELALRLSTGTIGDWDAINPQGMLYLNGRLAGGLDINHRQIYVEPDTHYEVLLYLYVGMFDVYIDVHMDLQRIDRRVRKLYFDMKVPYDAALCYPEEDYTFIRIMKYLEACCNRIDFRKFGSSRFIESVEEADRFLREEFYGKQCGASDVIVSYVGHTHIDVAWLWTLDQTKEKAQRTFSNVLNLMERYPEYIFMSSQPQLFKYLKEEAPEVYRRVQERVREGRFEMDGAMWLEADCNLTSGESLVRQIIHGKRFMKTEFGVESTTLWLPDVFGYSAALPQILNLAGVSRFVTSKISWNETNKMPYDTFLWQGIDGTEIFTYFMTARDHDPNAKDDNTTTYNGDVTPSMNLGTWERYQQKEYSNEVLVTFGYGDGGGGPTEEMLEAEQRLEAGLPGQPAARMSRAGDFLTRVEQNFREGCAFTGRTPKWVGELYLEKHRGTYTSMAKNKRNNRKSEFLLQTAEAAAFTDCLLLGRKYPKDLFYRNWETVLLNQFHDIIPGSSIREVYERSDLDYASVRKEVGEELDVSLGRLAASLKEPGYLIYNPNGFPLSGYAGLPDGKKVYVEQVPALGYKLLKPACAETAEQAASWAQINRSEIRTPYYRIRFDEKMRIVSLYDLEHARENVREGGCLNLLRVYENYPYDYDNWELCNYYEQKYWDVEEVSSVMPFTSGGAAGLLIRYRYMDSEITQRLTVYEHDRRIDFETEADWHEDHVILKALFDVDVKAEEVSSEIQFGYLKRPNHRNTSWDSAKFEICAQKWLDMSEAEYGFSILNDCKYGHSAKGQLLTLSLIKTGTEPNEVADIGQHRFTYALLPHTGGIAGSEVIREAYQLNRPLIVRESLGGGSLPECFSLVSADAPNVIIESVKMEEDGDGLVVRLYEAENRRCRCRLHFGVSADAVYAADLLEQPGECLGKGSETELSLRGFEIRTLLLRGLHVNV